MFSELNEYYDPMKAYQSRRMVFALVRLARFFLVTICRHGLTAFYESLMKRTFRKFEPLEISQKTMTPLENRQASNITIGGETWTGWPLINGLIWVLEERAHAPDEVMVYFTEEKHLHVADLTMELYPTWTDCDMMAIRNAQTRVLRMIRNGAVDSLTDSHTHQIYGTPKAAEEFVRDVLESHLQFQDAMVRILQETPGMKVGQIYRYLKTLSQNAAVKKHLDLEFPKMPPALQTLICTSLRQSGCSTSGEWGRKQFLLPADRFSPGTYLMERYG
jgi:hypothetical protein